MGTLAWLATKMRTGEVIADLPDLADQGGGDLTVASQMGDYQTCIAALPLPTAPENWERATMEGATTMVLLQDEVPVWGGYIVQAIRTAGDEVVMSLATLEYWLDQVYVGDESFSQVGQNSIISYLVTKYATNGALAGIPIRVQITSGGVGKLRDRTYLDTDNKTLLSILQDLTRVDGGPEWTIGLEHLTGPERYTFVLYVGDRIGAAVTPGLSPAATFEMPGPVTEFRYQANFGSGKGATVVKAYSSGQGTSQPQSAVQSVTDSERPRFEYRWTPSTSITEVSTLNSYATSRLAQIKGGTKTISLSAAADDAPRLGTDWVTGDDIGYQIGGLDGDGRDTVPAFPGGLAGTVRAIGWTLTVSDTPIVTPVLAGSTL